MTVMVVLSESSWGRFADDDGSSSELGSELELLVRREAAGFGGPKKDA